MVVATTSYNGDVLMIANAFRAASDEDTRQVLNVMSAKKTSSSLSGLTFFLVPSTWLLKAWPMLSAGDSNPPSNGNGGSVDEKWRERVGMIQNGELLSWDRAVSSSDEEGGENGNSKPPKLRKQQKPPDACPLRSDLAHGEDYFLLGPSAWLLVKEKFGSDEVELGRPCVFHNTEESLLAVAMDQPQNGSSNTAASSSQNKQLIPIPPAGYFPYGRLIKDLEGDSESFLPQGRGPHAPQQQPLQQASERKQTDVVSDEDADPNDLFPGPSEEPDDMVLSGESERQIGAVSQPSAQDSVLLLPPSTTVSPANSNNEGSLYPAVQDMECSGDPVDDDVKGEPAESTSEPTTETIVPVATPPAFRQYGSGLGNLGNTCFMNSTLQCLAHTGPLRRYFLSGEYEQDLNRDNPLGTGGDLATQFAQLLAEMWGTTAPADRRRVFPKVETPSYVSSSTSSVVYPRNFKYTLGKHAEQFMGYDQHDSQELATYLLDALHEDTNRVTKKPYVEKPEKGEEEPDEVAAKKSWDLHLKREDSRVLENFMGQVKSRVQCCKEGCGRVSTTFDPFMYLSVPIPGSTERTMRVTFVPLDPQERKKSVSVTLNRAATVGKLVTKVAEQLMKLGFSADGRPFSLDELCPCDVWSHDVYNWYSMDEEIDKIRDTDETVVYQVQPKAEIQKVEEDDISSDAAAEDEGIADSLESSYRPVRYKVDAATSVELGRSEEWKTALENYLVMPNTQVMKILNARRGTNAERFDLHQKMDKFVVSCIQESDKASNKRAREEEEEGDEENPSARHDQTIATDNGFVTVAAEEEDLPALIKASEMSATFSNVKTRFDVAVVDYCTTKLKRMILEAVKSPRKKVKDGYYIQVTSRRSTSTMGGPTYSSSSEKSFVNPLVLRIPATLTVYGLREELARRLVRSLRLQQPAQHQQVDSATAHEHISSESDVIPMEGDSDRGDEDNLPGVESMTVSSEAQNPVGGPALQILRQIPLSYKQKKTMGYNQNKSSKRLGSLDPDSSYDDTPPISLASPTDDDEKQLVSDWLGQKGCLYLDWPSKLCDSYFDEAEFELADELKDPDEEALAARNRKANRTTTILDCVEKYCQMEQLEETEMWYCNRCKEHVRAWKQFHLYRAPPILIMHLKRFQYSASTHRRDKISTFIDFPLEGLDLSEIVMHFDEGQKPVYDCYAVSNHYGGLGGGHYTAYALNDDGVWCHYDDSRITDHVDPKEVVSEAAYVVYYRRKDVVVKGDFLESIETPAIVADHFDKKDEEAPSDASSTGAAQGDDMDVDGHSHSSSKTDSRSSPSPMDSGGDNNFVGTDVYVGDGYNDAGNNYPLQ